MSTRALTRISSGILATGVVLASILINHEKPTESDFPDMHGRVQKIEVVQESLGHQIRRASTQRDAEFQKIESDYPLPPGTEYNTEYPLTGLHEQSNIVDGLAGRSVRGEESRDFIADYVTYESGYFESDALVQWQCAWLRHGVEAVRSSNTVERDRAVEAFLGFVQRPEVSMFPDYQAFLEDNVLPLESNDYKVALSYLDSGYSCPTAGYKP